eukprot:2477472-Prymnesium_polylepis.1
MGAIISIKRSRRPGLDSQCTAEQTNSATASDSDTKSVRGALRAPSCPPPSRVCSHKLLTSSCGHMSRITGARAGGDGFARGIKDAAGAQHGRMHGPVGVPRETHIDLLSGRTEDGNRER